MDALAFTRDLEAAYRMAWRNWCAGGSVDGLIAAFDSHH